MQRQVCSQPLLLLMPVIYFIDQAYFVVTAESQQKRCHSNRTLWNELASSHTSPDETTPLNYDDKENIPVGVPYEAKVLKNRSHSITQVFPSLSDAIDFISDMKGSHDHKPHLQVLVCGSVHLVGGAMRCIGCTLDNILH